MAPGTLSKSKDRKPLRRSRFGCRNCKLRKLKCDENKPQCKRCCSYGIVCNFQYHVPDLQPFSHDTPSSTAVKRKIAQPERPLISTVRILDLSAKSILDTKCQDFVTRYLARSLTSPDEPGVVEANRRFLELAFAYPYLMHASIALALAHDRFTYRSSNSRRSVEECYHWSQSTILFNRRLRHPIESTDKDPIWATAATLAVLTFLSPDACTADDSWPLKSSPNAQFEWLRMNEGKMSLWKITNPLRPESLFHVFTATYARIYTPLPQEGTDGVPQALATLCQLDDTSTAQSNPYFEAAHATSLILGTSDNELTVGHTELFVRSIHGPFDSLLREKDPIALVLLYLWYHKGARCIWWMELRARVECPAICKYLGMYHNEDGSLHDFLPGGGFSDAWN